MTEPRDHRQRKLRRAQLTGNPVEMAVTYGLASSPEDLEASFRLVYSAYKALNLTPESPQGMRFTKYHLLPQTKIFMAFHHPDMAAFVSASGPSARGRAVGTATLVLDTPMGIPAEALCHKEVEEMRWRGNKVAEISALAVDPELRNKNVMMRLFKVATEYAQLIGVTHVYNTVVKKHFHFYRDALGFQPVGPIETYPACNNVQAQGHVLDIHRTHALGENLSDVKEFDPELYKFFFGDKNPRETDIQKLLTPWKVSTIREFVEEKPSLVTPLDGRAIAVLQQEYEKVGAVFPYKDESE